MIRDSDLLNEASGSESGTELAPGVRAPASALRMQFSRSAGPGGQNVNKVNTKAELWLALSGVAGLSAGAGRRLVATAGRKITQAGELHLTCETERTAEGNRQALFERLREMIVAAMVEPKRRRKTRPTRASKKRRLDAKRRRSDLKSNRRGQAEG
jgi:ribosome-associated protein